MIKGMKLSALFQRSALASLALGILLTPQAQAVSLGEFEYRNSCAQCHGMSGKGDGPVGAFLRSMPSDLTVLQKNNGGVFPVTELYSVIDGSAAVDLHGRDMPLWGNRYRARIAADVDGNFSPGETEIYVRTRILSLIEHLAKMQVE